MASTSQIGSNDNDTFSSMFGLAYLEPHVQCHLLSIYGCLLGGMMVAAGGVYVHLISNFGDYYIVCNAAAVVSVLCVFFTRYTNENVTQRMGAFNAFTFFSGVSSGPLIEVAMKIDLSVLSTAVSASAVVITTLSMAALSTNDRKFATMGELLYCLFFLMILVGFLNTYIGSRIIFHMYIFSSLVLFVFFIMYDTQLAVEKRIRGEVDFVWHTVTLFLDTFHMFKLILIVLAQKKKCPNMIQVN